MLKFMITAASSNSGKTAVTCGLLSLLKRKGYDPCAFKCGPDYIDPMFHRTVLGIPSSNLDVLLAGEEGVKETFARRSQGHGCAVCEGVMGYYDGIGPAPAKAGVRVSKADSTRASAWHVSSLLEIPSILVLRPRGAALTLAAVIKGISEFRQPSRICGVIFNDCSEMYYRAYGPMIEEACGIPVLGYLPHMEEAVFESRHLGLMTAGEIRHLQERIDRIGARMEESIDLERLFDAAGRPEVGSKDSAVDPENDLIAGSACGDAAKTDGDAVQTCRTGGVRIAIASDEAFNFVYAESITALEEAGAEIINFSPLTDRALPEEIGGLYLPGGYPELYGKQLAENESMRMSIRRAVEGGLPTIAECGGFLYLSKELEDAEGKVWPMAGVLPGSGAGTGKLVRFGYGLISADKDSLLLRPGEEIPVHEFHYWDSTQTGCDLTLTKYSSGKTWEFGFATQTLYAGFPHLYLAGNGLAQRFVQAARKYAGMEE